MYFLFLIFLIYLLGLLVCNLWGLKIESFSSKSPNKTRVVCVGDSILNNARYVGAGESVLDKLNRINESKFESKYVFDMLGRDGARMQDAFHQVVKAPRANVYLVSIGGNDLLAEDIEPRELFQLCLKLVSEIRGLSETARIYMLNLYYPKDKARFHARIAQWNAWLSEHADEHTYMTIQIDTVMTEPSDICFKIEPSAQGSEKIAQLIMESL